MNATPLWLLLLMHIPPVIVALAAWRSAARGARTSKQNKDTLVIVHELVNGRYTAAIEELERLRAERDALRG